MGVKLVFWGDTLLEKSLFDNEEVLEIANEADLVSFNLETVISNNALKKSDKAYNFIAREDALLKLKDAIKTPTLVNIANNHMLDFGSEGLYDTIDLLKKNNIDFVGLSIFGKKKSGVVFKDINGKRIAFIGAYRSSYLSNDKGEGFTNIDQSLIDKTKLAKKMSDYLVVHLHWGEELSLSQNPNQVKIAKSLVDVGVDVIIGHHPHVIQNSEVYKKGFISYSLGNFQMMTYDWNLETKYGLMLSVELESGKEIKIEKIPVFIDEKNSPKIIKKNSLHHSKYLKILESNLFLSKYNSWILFYSSVSKAFFEDNIRAWKRRYSNGEKSV